MHVTVVPGDLDDYLDWLVYQSWGTSGHTTRVSGPALTVVGGFDAAMIEYACLDYFDCNPEDPGSLPTHMSLLLVIVEVSGYLYRISLYVPEEELDTRGPEFQEMLDSWLWADLVAAD
jgi:hypothetical protein